jgi:hypothetical protein
LDAAVPVRTAAAPRRGWLVFLSLAMSIGLGVVTIFAMETLDTTFHTLDDLRSFSRVPVLACIPPIVTESDNRAARRRLSVMTLSMAAALVGIIGSSYFLSHENQSLVSLVAKFGGSSSPSSP